jgi:transposase InsO family protein
LEKLGIRQIVSRPRHPQTLGKIDRFWGSLWRERVETAVFMDLGDARTRIGHFIDHYNFQRPHQGLDGGDPLPAQLSGCQQPAVVFSESAATVTWNESFD